LNKIAQNGLRHSKYQGRDKTDSDHLVYILKPRISNKNNQ